MQTTSPPRRVEFAGWMPVFRRFGNCGNHPQFAHAGEPPPGFRFVRSGPGPEDEPREPFWQKAARLTGTALGSAAFAALAPIASALSAPFTHGVMGTARALGGLFGAGLRLMTKSDPISVARFLHSRHFASQAQLPSGDDLLFLTSVPYTYGQRPWVIEVEDATTLFFPFLRNGETHDVEPAASPYFPLVRALLEADNCRGIVTHIRSTAESMGKLFQSEVIARKTFHVPLGVRAPESYQRHEDPDGPVDLLFTNSWHQDPNSFFLRGGLEVLDAFEVLRARYPQVRLTMRSRLPQLPPRYGRILEDGWVRVISRFLPDDELDELMRSAHVFLLPAARIHIVSVLKAMAYGQAVVVSDGWGMTEHVTHGETGLVVPGRHGKASWMCERTGLLREDYRVMKQASPEVTEGLVHAVSSLIEDIELRRRLSLAARQHVMDSHGIAQWNTGLARVFASALGEDFSGPGAAGADNSRLPGPTSRNGHDHHSCR
jgi:glycosyltransferase involved in cell wall biosynthesis